MNQQAQQQAMVQMQAIKQTQAQLKVLGQCFTKCVPAMNAELSQSEQQCLYKCTSRVVETEVFLAKRLMALGEKAAGAGA